MISVWAVRWCWHPTANRLAAAIDNQIPLDIYLVFTKLRHPTSHNSGWRWLKSFAATPEPVCLLFYRQELCICWQQINWHRDRSHCVKKVCGDESHPPPTHNIYWCYGEKVLAQNWNTVFVIGIGVIILSWVLLRYISLVFKLILIKLTQSVICTLYLWRQHFFSSPPQDCMLLGCCHHLLGNFLTMWDIASIQDI